MYPEAAGVNMMPTWTIMTMRKEKEAVDEEEKFMVGGTVATMMLSETVWCGR